MLFKAADWMLFVFLACALAGCSLVAIAFNRTCRMFQYAQNAQALASANQDYTYNSSTTTTTAERRVWKTSGADQGHIDNRARMKYCPSSSCTGGLCITLNGSCSAPLVVNCDHVDRHAPTSATVVSGFWNIRTDRTIGTWRTWLVSSLSANMTLVAFLPPPLDADVREGRAARGLRTKTCIVSTPTEQLPYGYLVEAVKGMLQRLRAGNIPAYKTWNWKNPELANERYVLLQAGKIALLEAAVQLNLFNSSRYVWIDAGLSRHVKLQGDYWPSNEQMRQLDSNKLYVSTWGGYAPIERTLQNFCMSPLGSIRVNRNALSGTVLVASSHSLHRLFPIWTATLEFLIKNNLWNNEQVIIQFLGCFRSDLIGILDYGHVLYTELGTRYGPLSKKVDLTKVFADMNVLGLQKANDWITKLQR